MGYMDIYDRMKVDVPTGEVGGMKIAKFEVVSPDAWTDEHEKRMKDGSGDLVGLLQLARMEFDEGRPPKPGWYTRLSEGGRVWMSDTTYERMDHIEPVQEIGSAKAKRVIINGLGIGMVLTAALSYDHVEHVDVVEIDQRIIDLVGPHYQKDPRVHIHHADAAKQMQAWPADVRWDVGWTDIWPDICADNLEEMKSFTDFYGPRCGFHANWSEEIAKRQAWDNRHYEKGYLKFLTEEDVASFLDEDDQDYYDEEEDYDDE